MTDDQALLSKIKNALASTPSAWSDEAVGARLDRREIDDMAANVLAAIEAQVLDWTTGWHRCVESILTMAGLSPALGASEAATAMQEYITRAEAGPKRDPFNLLSEDWLRTHGFKWHQLDRQPTKHWLLWLGSAIGDGTWTCYEDLGIEVARGYDGRWFCWLRADTSGRYHRFIHIRHLETVDDLTGLIAGIIGRPFDPAHTRYGHLHTPERAAKMRQEDERLDQRLLRERPGWYENEKDETRGGPLIDHLNAHIAKGDQ